MVTSHLLHHKLAPARIWPTSQPAIAIALVLGRSCASASEVKRIWKQPEGNLCNLFLRFVLIKHRLKKSDDRVESSCFSRGPHDMPGFDDIDRKCSNIAPLAVQTSRL